MAAVPRTPASSPFAVPVPTHPRSAARRAKVLSLTLPLWLLAGGGPAGAWQMGPAAPDPEAMPKWAYGGDKGPDRWAELDSSFAACGRGVAQSPVALSESVATAAPCIPLRFRYRSSPLYLTNDGRALRLGYDRGSFMVIDGLSYELVELRFHVPSEHVLEGVPADAELQLIHANNRGDIAIVAVPLQAGRRVNRILRRVLEHAPSLPGESYYGRNVGVNALFLLPGPKDYYAYRGSLTRPPCTEAVRWYVMRTPVEVAAEDIQRLASLFGPNARPLQSLGTREVVLSCATP